MFSYSLDLSKMQKLHIEGRDTTQRRSHATQTFYLKQNRVKLSSTSRPDRSSTSQKPTKQGTLLSARHHTQNCSESQTKQFDLKQIPLRFQKTCFTEASVQNYSARSTSRNRSKKRKTTGHLFNFNVQKVKQNNLKDKYIQSFISVNQSDFIALKKDQEKSQIHLKNTSVNSQIDRSFFKDSTNVKQGIIKQTKHQKIRQKMRKLKTLTSDKRFKRKTHNQNTTEEEWKEIQKIVRLACQEEISKRLDTKETVETSISKTNAEIEHNLTEDVQEEQREKNEKIQREEITKCELDNPPNHQAGIDILLKEKEQKTKNQEVTSKISSIHQTIQSNLPEALKPSDRDLFSNPSISQPQLSFSQFYSLLLIYEHTLYLVPSIIQKLTQLCIEYSLEYKNATFLFFKQLYLNEKLIEQCLSQVEEKFTNNQLTYDYSEVVQQIKLTNHKNLILLKKLKQDLSQDNKENLGKESLEIPIDDNSVQSLSQSIKCLEKDFIASNMKIIKKLLKKISKSPKTNVKHFHIFLKYSSCFLNLSRVYRNIEQILQNSLTFQKIKINLFDSDKNDKNQSEEQKESEAIKQFLYSKCEFVETKYLQVKEKVFEMFFDIQGEHEKIKEYYHVLIGELKLIETKNKEFKQ